MNSTNNFGRSEKLRALAQQLRLYQPVPRVKKPDFKGRTKNDRAAVLVCIFEGDDGEFRVILTKRASTLSTHSGEVSLPGGKAEEGDANDAETATREAKEEIGLDPSLVNIVTLFEPILSKHFLLVTPVIAILPDKRAYIPALNPDEVEAVFDVPLKMFIKGENLRVEELPWNGGMYMMHTYDYDINGNKYIIWGLTSEILVTVASVVYQRESVTFFRNFQRESVTRQKSSKSKIAKL